MANVPAEKRNQMAKQPVILAGCRTPIGTLLGDLSSLPAPELGTFATRAVLERCGVAVEQVDEVIMGNVLASGLGQAPARQVAINAGIPTTSSALTINKMCASGLKAIMLAAQGVAMGDARVIVAGGIENMSRAPHLVLGGRKGWKFGDQRLVDSMLHDGLVCAFDDRVMGLQADYLAEREKISRGDQDLYAFESQRRAAAAIESGVFNDEIVPVEVATRGGKNIVRVDQGVRPETTVEQLASLKTLFRQDGAVTAGNASQISDGAAATVVASREFAETAEIKPMARVVSYAAAGVAPTDVFLGPVPAIHKALGRANLTLSDIDLFEINEAFAVQMLACIRPLDLPTDRLNVNGGAIALGHPIGASGARILVTLLHAMRRRGDRRGLAALCHGGGGGIAMIVELED